MNEAPPIFEFKIGDPVTFNGRLHYWGPRSGSRRVLRFSRKGGGGILIDPIEVGNTVFPGTNEYGAYEDRHAVILLYRDEEDITIRVRLIQVAKEIWKGCVDASYGDIARCSGGLHPQLPSYESAKQAFMALLSEVVSDLTSFSRKSEDNRKRAKDALVKLLSNVSPDIREAVLAIGAK
jgi:hypothetical protein